MARQRVVAAMSGGVDSAVAAALLKQQGYDVIGVTMQIWPKSKEDPLQEKPGGCCSLGAVDDARAVAYKLNIPYYVLNMQQQFEQEVVQYFCREYARGRTPNPCIVCNTKLKFKSLLEKALVLGADYVATGHYARIKYSYKKKRYVLQEAVDKHKDQSYALYDLNQYQLAHTLFPLGELTKEETRSIAAELGLTVAAKHDSQEICFVPDDDYRSFLYQRIPTAIKPGPFVNQSGQVLGTHSGLPFYTIGQRRHLGISSSKRLYVVDIDPERNVIILGEERDLLRSKIRVEQVNWVSVAPPQKPIEAAVRVRYRGMLSQARLIPDKDSGVVVEFVQPARAPAPGQAAVFYQGEEVLGGGIITPKGSIAN
ncbi:MAG: tRNA 2-thiouridine(34) synthase MnmA [bacterium]|jgi:tRNA-specific 2-thiouridylase